MGKGRERGRRVGRWRRWAGRFASFFLSLSVRAAAAAAPILATASPRPFSFLWAGQPPFLDRAGTPSWKGPAPMLKATAGARALGPKAGADVPDSCPPPAKKSKQKWLRARPHSPAPAPASSSPRR